MPGSTVMTIPAFSCDFSDEANVIGAIDFNNLTAFVNEPRMYGVELSKRF